MGILPGLKAFIAAVLGGIGNVTGAVLGGFLLGMLEFLHRGHFPPGPATGTPWPSHCSSPSSWPAPPACWARRAGKINCEDI